MSFFEASKLRLRFWVQKLPQGLRKDGVEELGRDQALPTRAPWVSPPIWLCPPALLVIPTAKRGRQSLTNTALVSCLGTTESCSFESGIKTLIKTPICIKSEIMLISPQFPLPSPYGSPKLCVYLSTMWQPLEMANRNACCLRNTSPAKHTPALDDRLLRRVGFSGLRTQLCS